MSGIKYTNLLVASLLMLLCCTTGAMAQEENQVRTCEEYTFNMAKVQGCQETTPEGEIVAENAFLDDLELGVSEAYKERFFNEVSDYALANGLPMIASCSQEEFEKQMESGVVKVDNYSPGDGFLNKKNLRVGYFKNKYCIVVKKSSLGAKVYIIPVDLENMTKWENADEAVAQARYFGYGYDGVTVDQTEENKQRIMKAAESLIETKKTWQGEKDTRYYDTLLKKSKAKMEVSYDSHPIIGSSEIMENEE